MDAFLEAALEETRKGLAQRAMPIGSALALNREQALALPAEILADVVNSESIVRIPR